MSMHCHRIIRLNFVEQITRDQFRSMVICGILVLLLLVVTFILPFFVALDVRIGITLVIGLVVLYWLLTCVAQIEITQVADLPQLILTIEAQDYQPISSGWFEPKALRLHGFKSRKLYLESSGPSVFLTGPYWVLWKIARTLEQKNSNPPQQTNR